MGHTEKEDMKVEGILLGRSDSAGGRAGKNGKRKLKMTQIHYTYVCNCHNILKGGTEKHNIG